MPRVTLCMLCKAAVHAHACCRQSRDVLTPAGHRLTVFIPLPPPPLWQGSYNFADAGYEADDKLTALLQEVPTIQQAARWGQGGWPTCDGACPTATPESKSARTAGQ